MLATSERRGAIAAGAGALVFIGLVVLVAVWGLLRTSMGMTADGGGFDAYIWRITRFTLVQALLSTALSIGFALPVARALARRPHFLGRNWLLRLFAVPLGLPAIVAALGLIGIWGRQGFVNDALGSAGLDAPISIYGLPGILLAHVFFNMPLAARLILAELERTPAEYWRTAAQLGLPSGRVFRIIEWPAIVRVLPGVAGLVFMLCATSFTLVLLLGGGPGATTIEVAIYQSLRFDFDPGRAVLLALLQIGLTATILLALSILPRAEEGPTAGAIVRRFDASGRVGTAVDTLFIGFGAAFVVSPLVAVAISGLAADLGRLAGESSVRDAALTSLSVAFMAASLSLCLATAAIYARHAADRRNGSRWHNAFRTTLGATTSLILLVPPVVLGAGWFVFLRGKVDVFAAAPVVVVGINALMALPFVMRVLEPAHRSHAMRTDHLSAQLGLTGLNRLRRIDVPALIRPVSMAAAFAMALSLGDLGAVALFGNQDFVTLPYLLLQRMGSYRTDDAAGLALLIGVVCLLLMMLGTRSMPSGGSGTV
ncbi:thiamine/thiamine pyrophosphate ABC transporter permease [Pararhizobium haloflavum]|uniref:thiamine/thiamine pyrophosphate ABC transporter permease n=1 Tax=Pararhizobium haloflavum TaxID=2037914 RepID=UPI000C189DAA|nr:thiamine/thiamine pyrophosphate ABC transporter permease [Pararhizobium haloflavum]